jgi:hypothetical protein
MEVMHSLQVLRDAQHDKKDLNAEKSIHLTPLFSLLKKWLSAPDSYRDGHGLCTLFFLQHKP